MSWEEVLPRAVLVISFIVAMSTLYFGWPSEREQRLASATTTTVAAQLSQREIESLIDRLHEDWDRVDVCPYLYSLREQGLRYPTAVQEVAAFLSNGPPIPQVVDEVRQMLQRRC